MPRYLLLFCLIGLLTGCASQRGAQTDHEQANAVAFTAMNQVGVPYRYGGNSPKTGFDCSGLIGFVYRDAVGIPLPRTVNAMSDMPSPTIHDPSALNTGDLLLFRTGRIGKPDHAGIYVGKGRFVHAPSRGGKVRLEPLDSGYWSAHFLKAKRPLGKTGAE